MGLGVKWFAGKSGHEEKEDKDERGGSGSCSTDKWRLFPVSVRVVGPVLLISQPWAVRCRCIMGSEILFATSYKTRIHTKTARPNRTSNFGHTLAVPFYYYFLTLRACFTKFSITPSNASRSPIFSSVRFFQYSKTSFAVPSMASSLETCVFNSSFVIPSNASSVVMQRYRATTKSSSGCGGGPFLLFEPVGLPWVSTDVDEVFPSPCRSLDADLESLDLLGEVVLMLSDGRISFFCLDAGRISSRSTGTPRETRNRRRVRDRIQSGGANGGGATNWDQREADLGVKNIEAS